MLKFSPAVFAVGTDYQIVVTTVSQAFVSIKIGNEVFVDDSNGILKSSSRTHNIAVPQKLLDKEKHYTVIEKGIIKRLAYFSKTRKDKFYEFDFRPVPDKDVRCYHIADAHNDVERPVAAALKYGPVDFLILNGDIPEDSSKVSNFNTIFELADRITHGNIPVVFARGNHDLRGVCAEKFAEYAPALNGKTYYSFRLGKIWGLCLDCGEDKNDSNEEYGCTVACHQFRVKETEYIKSIIKKARKEYAADDVELKLIIVHSPFTEKFGAPFDIEPDIYTEWARLLKEHVRPDLMICGHTHRYAINEPGCEADAYGQPCTVVVGSEVKRGKQFGGAGFYFGSDGTEVTFTNSNNNKKEIHKI